METSNLEQGEKTTKILTELKDYIRIGDERKIFEQLQEIEKLDDKAVKSFARKKKDSNSFLRQIVQCKYKKTTNIITNILNHCDTPFLCQGKNETEGNSLKEKTSQEEPTILHIAIARGNIYAVIGILKSKEFEAESRRLLTNCAQVQEDKNTHMIGQLPLSVAALRAKDDDKASHEILSELLNVSDAEIIMHKNQNDDNVFHSLIKYGALYPEKIEDIKSAFLSINEDYEKKLMTSNIEDKMEKRREDWFTTNADKLTPLQLSAKLGVSELYEIILNLQNVYCYSHFKNELFGEIIYDVTEIDHLITCFENGATLCAKRRDIPKVLDMIFNLGYSRSEAFKILNLQPIKYIIEHKWKSYKSTFLVWMACHIVYMLLLTVFSILKFESLSCEQDANPCTRNEIFFDITSVINILVGLIYLLASLCAIFSKENRCRQSGIRGLHTHNFIYILCLFVLSVGIIIDGIISFFKISWNFHIIFALICGWNFTIYFLTPFKYFGSFTYMIRKALIDDLLPFAVIITIELIAFTGVMHIFFIGSDSKPEEFQTYLGSMITMFKLGIGLDDVGVLNEAVIPWLAYAVYVLYTVISYLLLINALIAIMSQTFSFILNKKGSQKIYQKMSAISLFEDIFCIPRYRCYRRQNKINYRNQENTKNDEIESCSTVRHKFSFIENAKYWEEDEEKSRKNKRYFCVIDLLEDTSRSDEEREQIKTGTLPSMRTMIRILNGEYFYRRPQKADIQHVYTHDTGTSVSVGTQTDESDMADVTFIQMVSKEEMGKKIRPSKNSS